MHSPPTRPGWKLAFATGPAKAGRFRAGCAEPSAPGLECRFDILRAMHAGRSASRRPMKRLHRPGDPYPVLLKDGLIDDVGGLVRRRWKGKRVAVVTQAAVRRHLGTRLVSSLRDAGVEPVIISIGSGEARKNLRTVETIYDRLIAEAFSRDDAILAFGGGMVGDVAGFVAATYLRGIAYAQIPTTLLAQIDSSIGAKVGVNHPRGKNLIGAFYRPEAIYIDPTALASLPARELRSGLFELLKYAFIGVPRLFGRFERESMAPGSHALSQSIADGARRKLDVVRQDESEHGLRRVLNFGHTVGHGLEAASSYRLFRHGEAVAWGMLAAIRLATRRSLPASLAERLEASVRSVGPLPSLRSLRVQRIVSAMQRDKKRSRSGLRFILPIDKGQVEIVDDIPRNEIVDVVSGLGARS